MLSNLLQLGFPGGVCLRSARTGLVAALGIGLSLPMLVLTTPPAGAVVQSAIRNPVSFSCRDSEATIRRKSGPVVSVGRSRIYAGYLQISFEPGLRGKGRAMLLMAKPLKLTTGCGTAMPIPAPAPSACEPVWGCNGAPGRSPGHWLFVP